MSVHVPTYDEQWERLKAVMAEIDITPACEHLAYRYQMRGCRWCELHEDATHIEADMDTMARARIGRDA